MGTSRGLVGLVGLWVCSWRERGLRSVTSRKKSSFIRYFLHTCRGPDVLLGLRDEAVREPGQGSLPLSELMRGARR